MNLKSSYNIVFLGKAGVGKSSLINYLFNAQVAKAALGKPQTPFGFHEHKQEVNGVNFTFFDSSGIEVKNHSQWLGLLDREFENRNTDKPAYDWFHSIIYCVSSAGRFEDIDIDVIKKCISKGYRVIIALTWADSLSKEKVQEYQDVILHTFNKSEVTIIPVCSVETETHFGKTHKFGGNEIINEVIENFWHLIVQKLPKRCTHLLNTIVNNWEREQSSLIDNRLSGIGGYFSINSTHEEIKTNSDSFTSSIQKQIETVIKSETILTFSIFEHFSKALNISAELDAINFKVNPDKIYTKEQFGGLVEGFIWSGLATFFIGELIGLSKFRVSGEIHDDLKKYAGSIRTELDKIEMKFKEVLEKNIVVKLQHK